MLHWKWKAGARALRPGLPRSAESALGPSKRKTGCADYRRCPMWRAPLRLLPHRPEDSAGFRNRLSRDGRVVELRLIFSGLFCTEQPQALLLLEL